MVEDDVSARQLIARVLRGAGDTVLQAEGGRDCLGISRYYGGEIHLLFTDLLIPGMDVQDFVDQM